MKVVGLFRELERNLPASVPSIHDSVGKMPEGVLEDVLSHLVNWDVVVDVMAASSDPFDHSKFISGGPSLHSDGVWVWRHDLEYLVRNYKVGLPEEFIRHVIESRGKEPHLNLTHELCDEASRVYFLAEKGESE